MAARHDRIANTDTLHVLCGNAPQPGSRSDQARVSWALLARSEMGVLAVGGSLPKLCCEPPCSSEQLFFDFECFSGKGRNGRKCVQWKEPVGAGRATSWGWVLLTPQS